jgi:alpha/beta superfamily hydrolase
LEAGSDLDTATLSARPQAAGISVILPLFNQMTGEEQDRVVATLADALAV